MPEQILDRYPVLIETREKFVVWIEAESQDDAVEQVSDDPDWHEHLTPENRAPDGYDHSVEEVAEWNWPWDVYHYSRKQGPRRGCGECGQAAYDLTSYIPHATGCSRKPGKSDGR